MPTTDIYYFQDERGRIPVREWLHALARMDKRGLVECLDRLASLESFGHELRRPLGDHLSQGIYELRARSGTRQYRLLYFFHGRDVVILAHAILKQTSAIPPSELARVVERRKQVQADAARFICRLAWRKELP